MGNLVKTFFPIEVQRACLIDNISVVSFSYMKYGPLNFSYFFFAFVFFGPLIFLGWNELIFSLYGESIFMEQKEKWFIFT